MAATHGIKKVSENILAPGRAIIVTEKDKDRYNWAEIPDGSLFIDTATGIQAVKLEGESDWVPANVKNDGTISIAKDNITKVESFTIEQESVADNPYEFIYTNSDGQRRHGVKEWEAGGTVLKGYIFTLEQGTYIMHRNHLKVTIDDVLHRSVATGGIEEIDEKRFRMTEKLVDKMEITVEYSAAFRMGAPYPRFFMNGETPETAEVGDFWLDTDGTLEEVDPIEDMEDNKMIGWDRIRNHPTTLAGYGITDELAKKNHIHNASDIIGLPTRLPAAGGHAESADFAMSANTAKKSELTEVATMAINDGLNRNISATYMTKEGKGATGTWPIDISGHADSARQADEDSFGRTISETYLLKSGGTMTGAVNLANNTMNAVGDDSSIGDMNIPGALAIRGGNGPTSIALISKNDEKNYAQLTYDGENIISNKTIQANIIGNASSASSVEWKNVVDKPQTYKAEGGRADSANVADALKNDGANMHMHWSAKNGQPAYVWGGNDAANMYVYNPSNFRVSYAENAGDAKTVSGHGVGTIAGDVALIQGDGKISKANLPDHKHYLSDLLGAGDIVVMGTKQPIKTADGAIWFDTASMLIKVYMNGTWQAFGAVFK